MTTPWLLWFLAGIAIMLAELAIPGFVILFFGIGCLGAAMIAAWLPLNYAAQIITFLLISVLSLAFLRKFAVRWLVGHSESSPEYSSGNVPIGTRIRITAPIEPLQEARVHFRGTTWSAISDEHIAAGEEAEIIGLMPHNRSCLKIRRIAPRP